jgi:hypothetical protein
MASFTAGHLYRLNKKSQHKNEIWKARTNLFRTRGLDCVCNFYKFLLSRAVPTLIKLRYIMLKLDEVYIAFFIKTCSIPNGKWKITALE